ncbi:hypothetical protein MRB53_018748 [Persea americana]|uniref:Uncharacterized protein n=1 Tax=Persea americana TaxID=3435 RepID=A0ACC2M8M4_PERAE|nr:hypothetical protein MRB53_018748 [Persea americana]
MVDLIAFERCEQSESFGVVYGDLSTSPIYVFTNIFSGRLKLHESSDDIVLGVLSLVFWTLTIIPLCKYIIFALGTDDNGEGGTFALYSLLCRRFKMSLLKQIYSSSIVTSAEETKTSLLLKDLFEKHPS